MARKPADRTVGRHLLKGLRYDSNGNPLYTCDTLSNEVAQAIGWRYSPKYGLYGQFPYVSDPTIFYESKKRSIRLTESELKSIITESVKNILNEIGDSEESRSNIRKAVKDDSAKRIKGLLKGTYKSENFTDKTGKKWVSRKAARNQNILNNLDKKEEKDSRDERVKVHENSFRRGRLLFEHEDDWFWEDDTAYIGRTRAYYEDDGESVYTPDYWTYSTNPNDKDFAGEVYQLDDEGRKELNWWIRCQRFNEYQRSHAFNPNENSAEEEWEELVQNYGTQIR